MPLPTSSTWGFGPNAAIKLNVMPRTDDVTVTFMVSMRELMSVHHSQLARDITHRAAEALMHHLAAHLDSPEFDREVRATVREELKAQVKQALIDRVDDIVEDLLT